MSFKYIIDSSAWYEYLEGSTKGAVIHKLIDQEETGITILAVAELADKFERENKSFEQTLQFIQSKAAVVPLSLSIVCDAAKIKKKQRASKTKFGLVDALHLATAKQYKALFVTTDKDFYGLGDVQIL